MNKFAIKEIELNKGGSPIETPNTMSEVFPTKKDISYWISIVGFFGIGINQLTLVMENVSKYLSNQSIWYMVLDRGFCYNLFNYILKYFFSLTSAKIKQPHLK